MTVTETETPTAVALTERLVDEQPNQHPHDTDEHTAHMTERHGRVEATASARHEALAADEEIAFNFDRTFRFMTGRRLQRRYRGVYKKYSFTAQLVTWLVVLYTLSMLVTLSFMFYFAIVVAVIYVIVQVALVIRWMVYWVIVASMLGYAVTGNLSAAFWLSADELSSEEHRWRSIVLVLLIVVECLTVLGYVATHFVYPWLVQRESFSTVWWWDVTRDPRHSNTLSYRSRARWYTRKRSIVTYCGGLDAEGRPHGYGMWSDTSYHGERLTGQWEHGLPVGPYRSFEHGSGYCFVNIRIGYCHNRGESRPNQIWFWPKHAAVGGHTGDRGGGGRGCHWGVASVECSVSGGFFTFLPDVIHLTPTQAAVEMEHHTPPQTVGERVSLLQSPVDDVIFHDKPLLKGSTKRSKSRRRSVFRESSRPMIQSSPPLSPPPSLDPHSHALLSSTGSNAVNREALVLLHGYNCSLDYGMNRLAQLVTLGDFPTETIHPFVFSWPSGGTLAYYQARSIGAESDRTAHDFASFCKQLIALGYTTIHLIGHSMGARIYFQSLTMGLLDDVFEVVTSTTSSSVNGSTEPSTNASGARAKLATLTFANPDFERDTFVQYGGGYDLSRRFCDCITLYADSMDGALFFSEYMTKKSLFSPLNLSLGRRGDMIHRDAKVQLHQQSDNQEWQSQGAPPRQSLHSMDTAIAAVNQQAHFEGVARFAFNRRLPSASYESMEASVDAEDADDKLYLDMDVIDTTWMDNNVHAIRHNYFNINPTVVDDLRDLIVTRRRAASRSGLLRTTAGENVYIFLVAPSHIKNK